MKCLIHIVLVALLLMGALAACNDGSCYDNGSSLPLASFRTVDTLGISSDATITRLSVMGIGVPGDSLLANNKSLSQLYMPLRANATTTSYALWRVFTIDSVNYTLYDTIRFDYEAVPYFTSAECGAMYNFNVHQVTWSNHGVIDSVAMLNNLVTNSRTPVMNIYFTYY